MKTDANHNNFGILRLVLATLVVFGHFKTLGGIEHGFGIYAYADFAVHAFFVVSGYLVYASYDRQPELMSFYARRIFRIYPLYAVVVIAQALAMVYYLGGFSGHTEEFFRYLFYNLLMANFMAYDMSGILSDLPNPGINPSLWTLKIEVAFYLILPLLWHLIRRFGFVVIIAIYALSTLYVVGALHYDAPSLARQLPGQLRYFVVGMALAHYQDRLRFSLRTALPLAVALFILCSLRHEVPMMAVYPLFVGLLVFLCALRLPAYPITFDISYGVYLFHGPLIQFALLTGVFQDSISFLLLLLVVTFALSFIAERLIEQPGIEAGKRLSRAWQAWRRK